MFRSASAIPSIRQRPRNGFTLPELLITVLIIGILAAVASPAFIDSRDQLRVSTAAARIEADLNWTRQQAVNSSTSITVQFAPVAGTYSMVGVADPNHPGQSYAVNLAAYPYESQIVAASFGGDDAVTFDRFGQPDSGDTVIVQSGSFQQTVTLDANSGRASVP